MAKPVSIGRIERGLVALAYMMELDGPVYVPIYERLERELETMKRTEATMARARHPLENSRAERLVELGLKAKP